MVALQVLRVVLLSTVWIGRVCLAYSNICKQDKSLDKFSWATINPSEDLVWTECYGDKHCARLKVPLDYTNPNGPSAAIAIVRVHSVVSHNSPSYRGPILINPGGPGGSGVDMAINIGNRLQTIVGPEFDIIGFDPRGIARSIPRANFFSSRAERALFDAWNIPSPNASAEVLPRIWAHGTLMGQLARGNDDGSLKFIHTDYTARDMLRIVQKHNSEKLQYWGFSSVLTDLFGKFLSSGQIWQRLGSNFCCNDNVGRIVIDGVTDVDDYYATKWSNSLRDTDQVFRAFAVGCAAAGPSGCAFYSGSPDQILTNIETLASSLRARPIPIQTSTSHGILDFSAFRTTLFRSLYVPYAQFPTLAKALASLASGNASDFWELSLVVRGMRQPFQCGCNPGEFQFESLGEATWAVLCNDGAQISADYEDFEAYYTELSKTSTFADQWTMPRMGCLEWPKFPKTNFQGPFTANTSFPLLLIGNTGDPVTPLWSAQKVSKGFKDSVVLTQDSFGHCSLSGPSLCTHKHIRAYFLNGTLPELGTVCSVDTQLFPVASSHYEEAQVVLGLLTESDMELYHNAQRLSMEFHVPMF
ncbi:Abhydrolase-4 domain-containing protein [Mycena indigotica]|uniref:Abhydrolase-4 domain-containing protein n=1 Tax=Mycena indigotica TaxID=2126181 RepID=A0A8H6T014_9AGAR|nr:Abhydrolase-4 domain-containing protein [Mycena indigotica]KAF7307452.1 Abhydrolase-4 domain-containing protein [Mycena indigotica]